MSSRILSGSGTSRAVAVAWTAVPAAWPQDASTSADRPGWIQASQSAEEVRGSGLEESGSGAGNLQQVSTRALEQRIHELEAELTRRHEAGMKEGYAAGAQAGAESAEQQWKEALGRLARGLGDLATFRARFRKQSEQELLRLSLAIARKILHRELTIDPQALLGVIKAAIEAMNHGEILRVRVASEDISSLNFHLEAMGLPSGVELNADRSLERGSVLIDTHRGVTDASIGTQLNEIERGFIDRVDAA